MSTIIKRGATVHACYRTADGDVLGSACRFKGTVTDVSNETIGLTDQRGVSRRFSRRDVHHLDDCPYEPHAVKARP